MFKVYSRADIMEKIADKVKSVEDLSKLNRSEFDKECCDSWYKDYLDDPEYRRRGYISNSNCLEMFYAAFYLMECVPSCDYLVLVEYDGALYFIFSLEGLSNFSDFLNNWRENFLRQICDITYLVEELSYIKSWGR